MKTVKVTATFVRTLRIIETATVELDLDGVVVAEIGLEEAYEEKQEELESEVRWSPKWENTFTQVVEEYRSGPINLVENDPINLVESGQTYLQLPQPHRSTYE